MKKIVRVSCFVVWILSNQQLGAEQLYGHDILLDEHTVLFTEGSKSEIEEDGGRRWAQRFPLIHIEDSDTCELLGSDQLVVLLLIFSLIISILKARH